MSAPTSSRQPPSRGVRSTASGCPVPDSAWARPPPKTARTGGGSRLSALITACPDGVQTLPSGRTSWATKPPPPSAGGVAAAAGGGEELGDKPPAAERGGGPGGGAGAGPGRAARRRQGRRQRVP